MLSSQNVIFTIKAWRASCATQNVAPAILKWPCAPSLGLWSGEGIFLSCAHVVLCGSKTSSPALGAAANKTLNKYTCAASCGNGEVSLSTHNAESGECRQNLRCLTVIVMRFRILLESKVCQALDPGWPPGWGVPAKFPPADDSRWPLGLLASWVSSWALLNFFQFPEKAFLSISGLWHQLSPLPAFFSSPLRFQCSSLLLREVFLNSSKLGHFPNTLDFSFSTVTGFSLLVQCLFAPLDSECHKGKQGPCLSCLLSSLAPRAVSGSEKHFINPS